MVDPIGGIGLALAGLTFPAQAFSSCVLAYTTVSDIRTAGKQLNSLFWLFKVQHTRFLVWGQNSDIYRDGISPENLSQPVYETIISTLTQIKILLQDVDQLRTYYGLHQLPASNMGEPQVSTREINRQATMVFQVQKRCSLFRRMKWAVHDADRFAGLVTKLTQFNDALYQFSPLINRQLQTLPVEAEALALAIVNDGWKGVQELQQAVANGQMQARSAAFLSGLRFLATENGPNAPISQFIPARNLFLPFGHVQMLRLGNDTPKRRSWGQMANTFVVVEWRQFNQMTVVGQLRIALQTRVEALVRMLQEGPKPPGFRILDCLGYLEDNESSRFGLVFRYPQLMVPQPSPYAPLTLFQVISTRKSAYLGERFQLAGFLAESLYELHASRWLHKSINSHNILFFQYDAQRILDQQLSSPVSLANPYFTGFALARPDDPNPDTDKIAPDTDVGIYRHPDVQGLSGRPIAQYHCLHDIYSLGAVLLEIGTWCPLSTFYQTGQSGPAFRDRLLQRKVPLLGISMGENYMAAVRKCLDSRFDGMQHFHDHERDQPDFILNLQRSFYWEVVKVLKECRV